LQLQKIIVAENKNKNFKKNLGLAILLCLTLGLAPFFPEPHIVGKVRWVLGGAEGMSAMDWFDLALHGSPFIFLLVILVKKITAKPTS